MSWLSTYGSYLTGKQRIPEQSFRRHVLRYWVVIMFLLVVALTGGMYWLTNQVSTEQLQTIAHQSLDGVERLYPADLEVVYDPVVGITTNATGSVIWSTEQVIGAFALTGAGADIRNGLPKNMLVLDLSGSVESLTTYDTLLLLTQTYMYARSSNEMKIYPLISPEAQQEITAPIRLNKTTVTTSITQAKTWVTTDGGELRTTILRWLGVVGIVCIPLVALFMTAWFTLGMLLVTLLGWLLSKIWVRCSWNYLFTGLSLLYLPWYLVTKILVWTGVIHGVGIVGYLVMVACLAILIVREEEQKK